MAMLNSPTLDYLKRTSIRMVGLLQVYAALLNIWRLKFFKGKITTKVATGGASVASFTKC